MQMKSDGNMQEGSLRCDVIILCVGAGCALRHQGGDQEHEPFSAIQKAREYEIKRQIKAYESGEPIVQETRLGDEGKQSPRAVQQGGASDYRAFPDPDPGPIEGARSAGVPARRAARVAGGQAPLCR